MGGNGGVGGGSVAQSHGSLSDLKLAASGVTYGHVDDQAQTIAGAKTFSNVVTGTVGFSGWGIVPVGSTLAWLKSFTNTPALPDGYVECNGQTLSDSDSVYNGQTIPDLNGSSGTQRFLRGSTSSGTTGGSETHRHAFSGTTLKTNNLIYVVTTCCGSVGPHQCHTHQFSGNTGYNSTLPSYYEVVWVIRIK